MELSEQKAKENIDNFDHSSNNSGPKSKNHSQLIRLLRGIAIGALFIGVTTPFTFHAINSEAVAHVIAIVGWLSICALPLLMPVIALLSGQIASKGWVTYREVEPVRFWVGLITYETLAMFFAFLATLVPYMYLIDRN